jgi:hypothetical protein
MKIYRQGTFASCFLILFLGTKKRFTAGTNKDAESSRSHSVFTLKMVTEWLDNGIHRTRSSRLHIIDLAGSERQTEAGTDGLRIKEGKFINK